MSLKYNEPREFLFDFPHTKLLVDLHIFAKQHNMNRACNAEKIRLIRPRPTFLHLYACKAISLNNLMMEIKLLIRHSKISETFRHAKPF